jgi:hypothetical protein
MESFTTVAGMFGKIDFFSAIVANVGSIGIDSHRYRLIEGGERLLVTVPISFPSAL